MDISMLRKENPVVGFHLTGQNQDDHHGRKHTGTMPGSALKFESEKVYRNPWGEKREVIQSWEKITVTSHMQFYDGIPVARCWTAVENRSEKKICPEHLAACFLTGVNGENPRDEGFIHLPHNTWFGEAQWKKYTLKELGYDAVHPKFSMKRISLSGSGSWPSGEHLPMGCYETETAAITWQIESAAAWHWEISDLKGRLYLSVCGPDYQEHGFLKEISPGETVESVACAIAFGDTFSDTIRSLTAYRRAIRRENSDNAAPKVIFNDYMNCLMGDPTEEKEIPLIDAAAEAGCAYYCVDSGWYADGDWWDGVGEWLPSEKRFPGGIKKTLDYIREKGMIPGLWLELEVMGVHCPLVKKVPPAWFFRRGGLPLIDHGRYQLDYRNPEVRAFADSVIDRLVKDYGAGYIKMDYNINIGQGTDHNADSAADGLLQHTRAYLAWLDGVFARYPELVIENCGSGGMRMVYPLLARHSIQSVTDQEDYVKMAAIACNCMTAVPPEQAAIWSYPQTGADEETVIFNMVNAMLLRIHQSGHLAALPQKQRDLVREGIAVHKRICADIKNGFPFWPLGLASMRDEFIAAGVDCGERLYLAVWRTRGENGAAEIRIPLPEGVTEAACIYPPAGVDFEFAAEPQGCYLVVRLAPITARLFECVCFT
ncbi:MAG: alpha-galactosidase [Clostridiales bacterium]|jgi:alpha-galactosidase|nr:alpha-galactosidase [Clostridiales bacterium]